MFRAVYRAGKTKPEVHSPFVVIRRGAQRTAVITVFDRSTSMPVVFSSLVTAVSLIDPLHRLADTRIAVAMERRPFRY
jgi:hypothetical protein